MTKRSRIIMTLVFAMEIGHGLHSQQAALTADSDLPSRNQDKSTSPVIESLMPVEGGVGDTIEIRGSGFMDGNDIEFRPSGKQPLAAKWPTAIGYINHVHSTDGRTLTVTIPKLFGACALTRLQPNEACPDIGILLTPGFNYTIAVLNANGMSNDFWFRLIERVERD